MNKRVVTFGEIMMRLSAPGFSRFTQTDSFSVVYAGSEANVSVSLSNFGISASHVTRLPGNDLGEAAAQSLRRYGVDTRCIVHGDGRLGIYFLEKGSMQRASRIIYDRFDSAFAHIQPGMVNWDEVLEDASWFHYTGITPAISQGAADVCLEAVETARKKGIMISGDINYRRNLWRYGKTAREVMPALIAMSDIVVGGATDFQNCLGISADNFEHICKEVMAGNPGIKKITTTHRESLSSSHNRMSATLWTGKELLESKSYDITHIVDRVGTGDAYMAGLIYAWLNNKDDQQALDFGLAACTLKHSIEGDVNVSSVQEIEALIKGENIGKLLR